VSSEKLNNDDDYASQRSTCCYTTHQTALAPRWARTTHKMWRGRQFFRPRSSWSMDVKRVAGEDYVGFALAVVDRFSGSTKVDVYVPRYSST
jgi:hypothetical protein